MGDKLKVTIAPEEGYGVPNDKLTQVVPLSSFPDKEQVKVGVAFSLHTPEGMIDARVTSMDEENATLDFNHPLAGVTLNFDVEIMKLRDPSEEELAHGHVHDGHHHHH